MKNKNFNEIYKNGSKLGLNKEEIKKILEYQSPTMKNLGEDAKYGIKYSKKRRDIYKNEDAIYGSSGFMGAILYTYGSVSIYDFN